MLKGTLRYSGKWTALRGLAVSTTLVGVMFCPQLLHPGNGYIISHCRVADGLQIICRPCFFFFFFSQIEGLWQPLIEQVYQCHFSNSICLLHVSVSHLWWFSQYFKHFHFEYICHGDQWLLTSDVTTTTFWRLRWWLLAFFKKYICPLLSLSPTPPLSHPSRLSQSTEMRSLCYTTASH